MSWYSDGEPFDEYEPDFCRNCELVSSYEFCQECKEEHYKEEMQTDFDALCEKEF